MPIYEYECGTCGRFEVLQKMSEPPLKRCEKCDSLVQKLVSQSSFALKGGGWYKDLYSSPSKDSSGKSSGSSPSEKSDSKSSAKSAESSGSGSAPASSSKSSEGPKKAESKPAAA